MNSFGRPNRATDGIPGDLATLIPEYMDHRRARGAAVNTMDAYRRDLALLQAFAERHDVTLVQLVSERLINRWLDDGLLHLGWSQRTAARRLTCVRTFLKWTRSEGYVDHDATSHVRIRFRPRRVIAPEMQPLLDLIAAIPTDSDLGKRDRALFLLLLDPALRSGEVAALDLRVPTPGGETPRYWVDTIGKRVYVPPKGGDGEASDIVGIEEQTAKAVQAWGRVRGKLAHPDCPALFVNQKGGRLSRASLYTVVRARGVAAGLPKLHPHLFRHRRIGEITEKMGLHAASAQARHRHVSTTANVYGAHAAEVQRHTIRTLCPLGEVRP